jgi:hypothetical protein
VRPLFGSGSSIAGTPAGAQQRGADARANGGPPSKDAAADPRSDGANLTESHPEVYVGAAFVAGVTLAILARRLGR